jgi:hypothetical protein
MFFTKYQMPNPIPATPATTVRVIKAITNLNFRYRFLSGGDSDDCGKYGGGV